MIMENLVENRIENEVDTEIMYGLLSFEQDTWNEDPSVLQVRVGFGVGGLGFICFLRLLLPSARSDRKAQLCRSVFARNLRPLRQRLFGPSEKHPQLHCEWQHRPGKLIKFGFRIRGSGFAIQGEGLGFQRSRVCGGAAYAKPQRKSFFGGWARQDFGLLIAYYNPRETKIFFTLRNPVIPQLLHCSIGMGVLLGGSMFRIV